jgi:aromatic-L-amino-acid decarboxylase
LRLVPDGLRLDDRDGVLRHAEQMIAEAWKSFDQARPTQPPVGAAVRALLSQPIPENGADARSCLDAAAQVLDVSIAQPRPRYFAYVGSSGLEIGVLGDALMACHDVNVAVHAGGADLLEAQVVRWVGEFTGFGATEGVLGSGGTISNLTALCAARERAAPGFRERGGAGTRLTLYCSREAHYSVRRAAEILGVGGANVRSIEVDGDRRMDAAALADAIDADVADGAIPVAVVATTGTTLTGAVDDLAGLADVCEPRGVWLHADGAYGLPAAATPSAGPLFDGLDRTDSATVDAHKWLYVPKACSVLLVRDPTALSDAFAHNESYMPHVESEQAHAVDRTLEYSRPLRALKLWLAFSVHGATAIRAALERNLEQARLLYDLVGERPGFEAIHVPQLSAVNFRHTPPGVADLDAHNVRLACAVQEDGRFYLAPSVVDGRACLRACFVNYRTSEDDVRALLDVVEDLAGG